MIAGLNLIAMTRFIFRSFTLLRSWLLYFLLMLVSLQGALVPKKSTFPSGMKAVADYVHSKGLKLGIYSDAGYFAVTLALFEHI